MISPSVEKLIRGTLSDSPLQTSETESQKKTINKSTMFFSCQPCGINVNEMNRSSHPRRWELQKHQILHNKNCYSTHPNSSPDPVSLRYLQCLNHRSPAKKRLIQPNTTEHDQKESGCTSHCGIAHVINLLSCYCDLT